MALGPIEVIVLGFPGSRFTGEIRPRIMDLVERGIVSIVDALLIKKDQAGEVTFIEMAQQTGDPDMEAFASQVSGLDLLSSEDVDEFAAALEPGSSALAAGVRAHLDAARARGGRGVRRRAAGRHPRPGRSRRRGSRRRRAGLRPTTHNREDINACPDVWDVPV